MQMEFFEKEVVVGDYVLLDIGSWAKIKEIHETRNWVKVEGWEGSWQRKHALQISKNLPEGAVI